MQAQELCIQANQESSAYPFWVAKSVLLLAEVFAEKGDLYNARAALAHSNLPQSFWDDAIRDATFKYNCLPHSATDKIPYLEWHSINELPKPLPLFGQHGHMPIYKKKSKLESRSDPCQ